MHAKNELEKNIYKPVFSYVMELGVSLRLK